MPVYTSFHVLYYFGLVGKEGEITFCLQFKGEKRYVDWCTAQHAMTGAKQLHFPIICLN